MATQAQILASWRSLLGGAKALIDMGGKNELAMARRHVDHIEAEIFLAQILGLPPVEGADWIDDEASP